MCNGMMCEFSVPKRKILPLKPGVGQRQGNNCASDEDNTPGLFAVEKVVK
jgi:hypothetical protein